MYATIPSLFGFFGLGTQEIMLLLVLGVLLFGRNLPQLGRSLGKTVTEFKRGVKGLEDDTEPTAGGAPRPVEPEAQLLPGEGLGDVHRRAPRPTRGASFSPGATAWK